MYDITNLTIRDITECGDVIRELSSGAGTMEVTANRIVRFLYDKMVYKQTRERAFALVRFFKTHVYDGLDTELREFAHGVLGDYPVMPELKCLVLLASAGDKPEWNSRKTSLGHKAIPLSDKQEIEKLPMISYMIKQLGIDVNTVLNSDQKLLLDRENKAFNVCFVPEAHGSPYVVAQDTFVIPYRIKSVVGIGGILSGSDLFTVVMFTKVPISRRTADMFKLLSLTVKMAILPFATGPIFSSTSEQGV